MAIAVRRAIHDDLPAILAIYNHAILHLAATFDTEEQTLEARARWLVEHDDRYPVFVAVEDGVVRGWASLSPYASRPGWRYTVEDAIYLHHAHRGRGMGRLLLEAVMQAARALGYHVVIAQIVAENAASIALHRAAGFVEAGLLHQAGYKFNRWHDVVLMEAVL